MKRLLRILFMSVFGGAVWYSLQHGWLIVRIPIHPTLDPLLHDHHFSSVLIAITCATEETVFTEQKKLLLSKEQLPRAGQLIRAYGDALEETNCLPYRLTVESIAQTTHPGELLCSLSHPPFERHNSINLKLQRMHELLRLIREQCPSITRIIFLHNHAPLVDTHLNFTKPWPITGFPTLDSISNAKGAPPLPSITTLILETPSLQSHSRTIKDLTEYGIVTQYAQALEKALKHHAPSLQIYIVASRSEPRPVAHLDPSHTLCVHLSAYTHPRTLTVHWYIPTLEPDRDLRLSNTLNTASQEFVPINTAYRIHLAVSIQYALRAAEALHRLPHSPAHTTAQVQTAPYTALLKNGLATIGCEIGMYDEQSWISLIEPHAHVLLKALQIT